MQAGCEAAPGRRPHHQHLDQRHRHVSSGLARLGQAADIARVVVFLATDEAGWVNGQTIRVNGGLVA
jgi:NAD(P)-dependent dehydrogenase (short-subunit alcohol dehydrogenase family)